MSISEWLQIVQTVGVPSCVVIASFYYIYKKDVWAREREAEYLANDANHDTRIFEMAQSSNKAISALSKSLDANTASLDMFRESLILNDTLRSHNK